MTFTTDLMAYGMPGLLAQALSNQTITSLINRSVSTTLTGTGTTIADALPLTSLDNIFTTVASGTGAKLPAFDASVLGGSVVVKNAGANALLVYPDSASNTINRGSAGAALSVGAGTSATFRKTTSTNWES